MAHLQPDRFEGVLELSKGGRRDACIPQIDLSATCMCCCCMLVRFVVVEVVLQLQSSGLQCITLCANDVVELRVVCA